MSADPYRDAASALMGLSRTLVEARAVRFQAPDRERSTDPQPSNRDGVSNPTLDTVIDKARWDLSTTVSEAECLLSYIAARLNEHDSRITSALARWNNEPRDTADAPASTSTATPTQEVSR